MGLNPSVGHAALVPVHFSGVSQSPHWSRQMYVASRKASVGQSFEVPVHDSGTSQSPAAVRHTKVLGRF